MQMYLFSVSNCATLLAMCFRSYSSHLPTQRFHSKYRLFLSKFANFTDIFAFNMKYFKVKAFTSIYFSVSL